jgi:F420-non-reducing hydrogenase small subunit
LHLRPADFSAPEGELELPALQPLLQTLEQVVDVDYRVPGCPPESERIADVIGLLSAALEGKVPLPPRGSVLGAGRSTVCDECRRDRGVKRIVRFTRLQELSALNADLCLLEQGLPCNGPATRDGCGAKCPLAGAPCIGCYGPAEGVVDFGARLLSAFASVIDAGEPDEIDRILDGLPDPVGQFYRFSLAGSLLRGARAAHDATQGKGPGP